MIAKRDIVFFALLFFSQIWTIKIGPLSVAMLFFAACALFYPKFNKIPLAAYLLGTAAVSSIIFWWVPAYDSTLHYSRLMPIISVFFVFLFLSLIKLFDSYKLSSAARNYALTCLLFSLLSAAIFTTQNFISAEDGPVGFFNEKGLYGYYLVLLGLILITQRPGLFSISILFLITNYVFFVVEASRALLLYIAFAFIYLQAGNIKTKIWLLFFALLLAMAVIFSNFGEMLALKLSILGSGEGTIGRYAAMTLVANSTLSEFVFGHGFGTYLNYRAMHLELPGDATYDYAGSLILELIFEVGLPATLMLLVILTKYVFGRFSVFLFCAFICLVAIGGKHDIQMLTSIIFMKIIYENLTTKKLNLSLRNKSQNRGHSLNAKSIAC
ncbi:hypothetical protein [Crenobacter cavernae]|uniref:hypothetical protein n=1 Tax=Crenobacter cavernae TaxID=2290923 RepID=UPI0011C07F5C|nr:hypothetical protein [Crenobacter cavernae]